MSPNMITVDFFICLTVFVSLSVASVKHYDPQLFLENGCPRPDAIRHGNFLLAAGHDRVHYICDDGYVDVGYMFASCKNGRWSHDAPDCVASGCETLKPMRYGTIMISYGGAIARFRCDVGHTMKGPEVIVCDGNQWNGTQPDCIDPLAYKKEGEKSRYSNKSNTASYKYRKLGERTIKSHEEWLQEADYTCIGKVEVVSPPVLLHASPFTKWILLDGRPRLYTIYRCKWGYIPVGDNRNLYCQNKNWVGPKPKCVSRIGPSETMRHFQGDEPRPSKTSSHNDWVAYADYSCVKNSNEVTAPDVAHAQRVARSTSLDGLPHLFVEYVCDDGYHLEVRNRKYVYCHKGSWLGDLPNCVPFVSNSWEPQNKEGKKTKLSDDDAIEAAEVTCDGSSCEQMCTVIGGKAECGCIRGYKINADGKSCSDINECANKNGGCHHTCVNILGSYKCKCHYGHRLARDKHRCFPAKRRRMSYQRRRKNSRN